MSYFKRMLPRLVTHIVAAQTLLWLFGLFNYATRWLEQHRLVTVLFILLYVFIDYICYDSVAKQERAKYDARLKGAALRKQKRK